MKNKFLKYISSWIFCFFVGALLLLFLVLPKQSYSSNEKRVLQNAPDFTLEDLADGSFGKSFESFLSDQFPLRSFFVGVNSYYHLFSGNNGSSGIYRAADGYLISKPQDFDPEIATKNIANFNSFVEGNNLHAVFLLVPTTGATLEDKLPSVHETYHDDAVFSLISESLSDKITFVDPRSAFSEKKDSLQIYYKTDHHITSAGAYLCYDLLCPALSITAVPQDRFSVETYFGFYGTTYSRSGLWLTSPDQIELWKDPSLAVTVTIADGTSEESTYSDLFFPSHLSEDDKYPVFLDGNHAMVRIENKNATGGKLLIVKDSFAHCLTGFLSENYSEITMLDLRYYRKSVSELVKESGIDTVLFVYGTDNFTTDSNSAWLQ